MFMLSFLACFSKTPLETAADMSPLPQLLSEIVDENVITQKIDVNGDGTPDVFNDYKIRDDNTRILIHKTVDLNWDGKVDIETWFSVTGEIEKEAMDGDFDGAKEWVDHYKGSKLVLSEVDTNFDKTFDLFRYYENEQLRRKEHDSNGDGNIDFWQYFDDNGKLSKTGRDLDGDGEMDVRN